MVGAVAIHGSSVRLVWANVPEASQRPSWLGGPLDLEEEAFHKPGPWTLSSLLLRDLSVLACSSLRAQIGSHDLNFLLASFQTLVTEYGGYYQEL